jgi:hypothetical protein
VYFRQIFIDETKLCQNVTATNNATVTGNTIAAETEKRNEDRHGNKTIPEYAHSLK